MLKAVVLDDYQEAASAFADWTALEGDGVTVDFSHRHYGNPDELTAFLQPYDVVVLMRERTVLDRSIIDRLPNLKLVVTTAMHNRTLDFDALRDAGVTVCGTRSMLASTVEHAWALILSAARNIPAEDANVRAGTWQQSVGILLAGKVLGLVGLGKLGARMIPIARAFGMRIIAWSPHLAETTTAADLGVEAVSKRELFERADVVSLHLVLGESSRGIVGAQELRAMKSTALLVNSARGALVDEDSLVAVLEEGLIAGAALDVYAHEPLPTDNRMRHLPNTVLTPHLGFVTDAEYAVFFGDIVEDLRAFAAGQPVRVITV